MKKKLSSIFIIFKNTFFIGCIFFSFPAFASFETLQILLNESNNLIHDRHAGIFIVDPDNINARSIKHYLSNAIKSTVCNEEAQPSPEHCKNKFTCTPEIKFIKLNPTKYRVKIINACRNFTLIFNERFDPMWKVYITKTQKANSDRNQRDYNKVESISNTVINFDNLNISKENSKNPNPRIWETWFSGTLTWKLHSNADTSKFRNSALIEQKSWNASNGFNDVSIKWPDLLHWEANAYANGWMFDLQGIKTLPLLMNNKNSFYSTNLDGSINFDVVIEYWPQRMYYLAYIISALSITLCICITIFMRFRISRHSN